jgi:hypothetical protein
MKIAATVASVLGAASKSLVPSARKMGLDPTG